MHTTSVTSAYPSPKRKRDAPLVPQLDTTSASPLKTTTSTPATGETSPHSIVADQLRELRIKPPVPILDFGALAESAMEVDARKRVKTGGEEDAAVPEKVESADTIKVAVKADAGDGSEKMPSARPLQSDILDALTASPEKANTEAQKQSLSGPSQKKALSPPPPSLTWQDSEITGHLVDPSKDPDDDGEGLNGIGFKPTPAIAYARSQQRRRQVNEWRAREAREARQKRSERRRRGVGTSSPAREDVGVEATRSVRFAA